MIGNDCVNHSVSDRDCSHCIWHTSGQCANWNCEPVSRKEALEALEKVKAMESAQPERDVPVKPIETTDTAWGIPKKQAVCPKCDYYLGNVAFLGDYKGKRITYCETCGQAIDWEGWEFDEYE